MKIKHFDRQTCKMLADEIAAALKPVADKYGVSVKNAGGTIGESFFLAKVEFAIIGEDGVAEDRAAQDFKRYAQAYGLQPDDLGKQFQSNGRTFAVCGLKPNAPKMPVLGRDTQSGKTYKFPAESIARKLHTAA